MLVDAISRNITAYIQLTKPRIALLVAFTGLATLFVEGSLVHSGFRIWAVCFGILAAAGSANAFNQYFDRDIDAVMERTRKKRPLPQGRITPRQALIFGVSTGVLGAWLLLAYGSFLAAFIGVFAIFFYAIIYTVWLKRLTPYNIVIGGASGAAAPLIAWAAATNSISFGAFVSFLVIFMWTPPHFWALALCLKEEYAKSSVPMLPVVAGEDVTRKQILIYSLILVPLTLVLFLTRDCGMIYLGGATLLGAAFLRSVWLCFKKKTRSYDWKLFGYSIVYIFALYMVMIADSIWK